MSARDQEIQRSHHVYVRRRRYGDLEREAAAMIALIASWRVARGIDQGRRLPPLTPSLHGERLFADDDRAGGRRIEPRYRLSGPAVWTSNATIGLCVDIDQALVTRVGESRIIASRAYRPAFRLGGCLDHRKPCRRRYQRARRRPSRDIPLRSRVPSHRCASRVRDRCAQRGFVARDSARDRRRRARRCDRDGAGAQGDSIPQAIGVGAAIALVVAAVATRII